MTISAKLAKDFVKQHFNIFEFETNTKSATKVCWYQVTKAYLTVGCADIYPFCIDTGATSRMLVKLPISLKAEKATLKEMLARIKHDDMDMRDCIPGTCKYYLVTTNRLKVLEELMRNSGLLVTKHEEYVFNPERIKQTDSEGNAIIPLTQNRLTEVNGVIIDGKKYYPAESIEHLCDEADITYSKLQHEYEKLWRNIDPKFIDAHCRMVQLSKDLSTKSLEVANNLIEKLTDVLKIAGK